MVTALLITLIPTFLFSFILPKIGINPKSKYLKVSFAWFTGLYFYTFATFIIALLYVQFSSYVLQKAIYTSLLLFQFICLFFLSDVNKTLAHIFNKITNKTFYKKSTILIITLSLIFSWLFFIPHLKTTNNSIYRSPIYWDFHWHVGVIQNFVYGDNFPPQNEAMAGIPMLYHFFGDFVMAIYSATGLQLTDAITLASSIYFFFLFMCIVGFCEEVFSSTKIGIIAALLAITSSSGHFLYYFFENIKEPFFSFLKNIFTNHAHPWVMSYIPGDPFNYTGVMFNLFYYVEERHALIASVFLLYSLWIIYQRHTFNNLTLFIFGCLMGGFFYWHIYFPIILLIVLFITILLDKHKMKSIVLFLGLFTVVGIQLLTIKAVIDANPLFNPHAASYPQFNFHFVYAGQFHSPLEYIIKIFQYFTFGYGLKVILVPLGLALLFTRKRSLAILFASCIIPLFIIINIFQTSPNGISENHKLILPMTLVINVVTAYVIYHMFLFKKTFITMCFGFFILLLLTISGIIELMPFLNSQPTQIYAHISNQSLSAQISEHTLPGAVFTGTDENEILLAGRKLFVGDSAGPSMSLDQSNRKQLVVTIYTQRKLQTLCSLTRANNISYVEMQKEDVIYKLLKQLRFFTARNYYNETVYVVDIHKSCDRQ